MKIDQDKCVACLECLDYCPMEAIRENPENGVIYIDEDECVECGCCLKIRVCPSEAIWQPELDWRRSLRAEFSDASVPHPSTGIRGRGTDEMKTNDITNRYNDDEVGIGIEFGRPGLGFLFSDLEKASVQLAKIGVNFELENPLTELLNTKTGEFKEIYNEVRGERALSAILECKAPKEKIVEIYNILLSVSKDIDTVFSLDIISKCKDGKIIVKSILDDAGIHVRINGKTNVGLGRPLTH